jgi:hypothetical protein
VRWNYGALPDVSHQGEQKLATRQCSAAVLLVLGRGDPELGMRVKPTTAKIANADQRHAAGVVFARVHYADRDPTVVGQQVT